MEKVLIMGGSYFIGKKIAEVMRGAGYEVFTLNRGTKPSPAVNIACDRNDRDEMRKVLSAYSFSYIIDVSGTTAAQAEILCSAIDRNSLKKFVFISSSAVYDVENLAVPFKESDRVAENKYWTFYGTDKIAAEKYYTDFFSEAGTELVILRPPYVYGEDNYAQRESFIFEHLCFGKPIILPSSNPKLQFIYAADLAKIILRLLSAEMPKLSVFNVGNKNAVTAAEWVSACAEAAGKTADIVMFDHVLAERSVRDFFPFFDYDNVLDTAEIRKIYDTETDFSVGLKFAYKWFLENKDGIVFKENVVENEKELLLQLKGSMSS
jgi:Nucleoside-diphosphate-sugar epimerases